MADLYFRAAGGETWDASARTSSSEVHQAEQDLIITDLQAATGYYDELRAPEAITVNKLTQAAKEDPEYN